MQAVLVATAGDRRLYYILDAKEGQDDGALVTSMGKVMSLNFFSFVNKTSGLKRITNTPFHRFLWNTPSESARKKWVETFISKSQPLDESFTENLTIKTSLDKKETTAINK